ncbi:MAG: [FeFe] hydrogenase, group A [Candidatus Ornithomonoglobus sp.]
MSNKISRRAFIRDSLYALFGMTAVCVLGKDFIPFERAAASEALIDTTSLSITRDMSKCIGCGKCVEICSQRQGLDILTLAEKDGKTVSSLKYASCLSESGCIGCGQCARHCPSGAITVKDGLAAVNDALNDSSKYIVWQFAPSAQHIIGEEFRILTGEDVSAKLATAAAMLGGKAHRTDFGADITIMEEASEFIECFNAGSKKPFMTSCCPGWVNYVELNCPEIIPHLSSCKSPMEMLGALIKSYLPEKQGINAGDIFHIAVMPCTAKKYECRRDEMLTNGIRSVDAVLTVTEFKNLLMSKGIDLASLPDGDFDTLFDGTSGAGRIFGATGGVCEAAMRTAYYLLTADEPPAVKFTELRGNSSIKTAELDINGTTVRACMVNGIANVKEIVESIKSGSCEFDFIEVMACRGGCSGGGGTPILFGDEGVRHRGLYKYDASCTVRSSHNNAALDKIYSEYLAHPCSEKSEELLHTSYKERG